MSMRELRRPPRLRSGDTVALVAPAGPVPEDLLDAGLAHLRAWGLDVRVGKHVRDRHPRLGYLAAPTPSGPPTCRRPGATRT